MDNTLTLEECKNLMERNRGCLDLSGTSITALPDNLTVKGRLDLSFTPITALPKNLTVKKGLYMGYTRITTLPDNLAVRRSLFLNNQITALPDNLTVGGSLFLNNQITTLPDGLTVGGNLDLRCTQITTLPNNLTVGHDLILNDTQIAALPDNLAVGHRLFLGYMVITAAECQKVKRLQNGDVVPGRYVYCDNFLTPISTAKKVGKYTLYKGKLPGRNVVSDGVNFVRCDKFRDGIADLVFRAAAERGADQYKGLSLDTVLTVPEAMAMYRVITGARRQCSEVFVQSLGGKLKEQYTIRECIELTKGQYNAERFAGFFEEC